MIPLKYFEMLSTALEYQEPNIFPLDGEEPYVLQEAVGLDPWYLEPGLLALQSIVALVVGLLLGLAYLLFLGLGMAGISGILR